MLTRKRVISGLGVILLTAVSASLWGKETGDVLRSPWVGNDYVDLRLISSHTHLDSTEGLDVALEMRLQEGWVTYWTMPGTSGFPPKIVSRDFENVEGFEISWPAPGRHQLPFSEAIGYSDYVIVPMRVRARDTKKPLRASFDWQVAVCEEICVLLEETLELTIPASDGIAVPHRTEDFAAIQAAKSKTPIRSIHEGMLGEEYRVMQASVRRANQADFLDVVIMNLKNHSNASVPEMYVSGPMAVRFGTPVVGPFEAGGEIAFSFPVFLPDSQTSLMGRDLTLVLVTPEGAFQTVAKATQ